MPPKIRKFLFLFLFVIVGLSLGLGYGYIQLRKEQNVHQNTIREMNRKISLTQKKYREKKALADRLMQTKYILEGKMRTCTEEIGKLKSENVALREENEKFKKENTSLHTKIKRLTGKSEKLKAQRDELRKKYIKTAELLKEREHEIMRLTADKQNLQAEAARMTQNFERCESKNAVLCGIAEALVKQYQDKGIFTAILHKEPLLKIKQVELEHFVQEYKDKVEKQKVIER